MNTTNIFSTEMNKSGLYIYTLSVPITSDLELINNNTHILTSMQISAEDAYEEIKCITHMGTTIYFAIALTEDNAKRAKQLAIDIVSDLLSEGDGSISSEAVEELGDNHSMLRTYLTASRL